jgi:hypothetical protein
LWGKLLKQNFNTADYTAANGVLHRATAAYLLFFSWKSWDCHRLHRGPTVETVENYRFPPGFQLENLELPLEYTAANGV